MALSPGARIGPYEIVSAIGAGGMGEVYRARDPRLGREVAIKVLPTKLASDADRLRRFEQEARAAGQLNHPGILAIHDIGTHDGAPYVVSELLEGQTLRERFGATGLPTRKAIEYALQIAHGLAVAHEKGIVHRDLKPENLFITEDGRVKILDFGLAKLTQPEISVAPQTEAPTAAAETEPGAVLGTVGYMSPEQVRGRAADHRSDIFTFGAILYEMLSGKRTFRGDSAVETMNAILKEDPPELSETGRHVSPELERIVRHCLEKSPAERFQSVSDIAFDLEALSGLSGPSGVAAGLARRRPFPSRSALIGAAAGLATGILVGIAAVRVFWKPAPPQPPSFQQLTFRRGLVWSARFALDGQTVVYGAAWEGAPVEIFTARVGSPESRSLGLASADVLSISSSGELAISLGRRFTTGWESTGTLARVPLAGGAPREILENVQDADWSPDGADLAAVHTVGGKCRLEYPIGKPLYETAGWISHPRVSPDGRLVAFADHPVRGDNVARLLVVDRTGTTRTLAAVGGGSGLAWAPSGKEIWISAGGLRAVSLSGRQRLVDRAPGGSGLEDISRGGRVLFVHNDFRREAVGLAPGETKERNLSWLGWSSPHHLSGDGRLVLFDEGNQVGDDGYAVYLRSTDGAAAVRLGYGSGMALSPDGRRALAILRPFTTASLMLLPTGAGRQKLLPQDAIRYQSWARWLPGGKRFLIGGSEPGHGLRIYLRDMEGGKARPVTPEGIQMQYGGNAISPDGKFVTEVSSEGRATIYPVEGGEPGPVPGLNAGELPIEWSVDGTSIFFYRPGELPARIYRLDLRNSKREIWKELAPADPAGILTISPILITPDGKSYLYSYRRLLSDLYLADGWR